MKYIITSENFTLGDKGELIEGKELQFLHLNVEALIEAGHIAKESASNKDNTTQGDATHGTNRPN